MPVQDIQMFHDEDVIVFNGPDEQFVSGLAAGAVGGIGGTYAAMPELFIKARELFMKEKWRMQEQSRTIYAGLYIRCVLRMEICMLQSRKLSVSRRA